MGIRLNLSWNETSSHFDFCLLWELGLRFEEKKPFLGFQLFKQREGKKVEKKPRYGNYMCMEFMYGTYMYGNPSLSKLCKKNPIRNVVGSYNMSFMVCFEFCLSWFWFGRKFPLKRAKYGNF